MSDSRPPSSPSPQIEYAPLLGGHASELLPTIRLIVATLLRIIGFFFVLYALWGVLDHVIEMLANWIDGTYSFGPKGPNWLLILRTALLRYLSELSIGALLIAFGGHALRLLVPRSHHLGKS